MQCSIAYGCAILCLSCLIAVESKRKKPSGGGGQGTGQGVTRAEFGELKEAIQLLIESSDALKTELKEDSASIRDEVSNLRDDVSNLRDGESENIASIREELSDVRDNLVELKESMAEMKSEISNDNTEKADTETKTNVPLFDSEVCNKSSTMFQEIKDQLKGCQKDALTTESRFNVPASSEVCNKSSRMFEAIKEQLNNFRCPETTENNEANGKFNESTSGTESLKEDLEMMIREQMKKLVETCRIGSDDQTYSGMDNIVAVLQQKRYKARFDLTTWENETRYAEYRTFDINDEKDKYRLNIYGYSGTAGDSMKGANHDQFSTKDSDNDVDNRHCAVVYQGPYWYGSGCGGAFGSVFGAHIDPFQLRACLNGTCAKFGDHS
ncbi:unnamed protein product [Owenia fusiformis]|uniref:Fibrinogen C-terminal domain-containing protein n=1 Tax=Owenia fusiformis TaxID=6347 RepID=A0A8S4Q8K0_OWEFU|nr:unnamed protein product [Owenia fusiformis]